MAIYPRNAAFLLELVCVTKQILCKVYMDFSFDMGICFLVSLELLRKLQKKDLEEQTLYFKGKDSGSFKMRAEFLQYQIGCYD